MEGGNVEHLRVCTGPYCQQLSGGARSQGADFLRLPHPRVDQLLKRAAAANLGSNWMPASQHISWSTKPGEVEWMESQGDLPRFKQGLLCEGAGVWTPESPKTQKPQDPEPQTLNPKEDPKLQALNSSNLVRRNSKPTSRRKSGAQPLRSRAVTVPGGFGD